MKKWQKYLLLSFISLVVIAGTALFMVWRNWHLGVYAETSSLWVKTTVVADNGIKITGGTLSSSNSFKGYDYHIAKDTLYINPRYSLVTKEHQLGAFHIQLKLKMKKINQVYIQGADEEDKKLIWQRKN